MQIYSESRANYLVEVISDTVEVRKGSPYRVVKLKCLEVLNHSKFCQIPVGHIWDSAVLIGYEAYAGWHLMES